MVFVVSTMAALAWRPRDFFYRDVAFFYHSSEACRAILKALLSLALKHTNTTRRHGEKYTRYRERIFLLFCETVGNHGKKQLAVQRGLRVEFGVDSKNAYSAFWPGCQADL